MKVAYAISVVLLAIILAVAAGSASWIFWEAWRSSDREVFRALLGGFSGAFFAFVFVRIGEGLKRLYERQAKNHSSLIMAEHYLNNCLNVTGDNVFVAEDFLELISEERLVSGNLPFYMNTFSRYEIDRDLLLGLTNIDFINELYSLNSSLRKLNDSLAATDRANEQLRAALLTKPAEFHDSYVENMRRQRQRYVELRAFLIQASEDIIDAIGAGRVQLKSPPFFVWLLHLLVRKTYSRRFKRNVKPEIVALRQEIEEVAKASKLKIEEAQKRAQLPTSARKPSNPAG